MNISIESEIHDKMNKCLDGFKKKINNIRTGRALPSLLDGINIDYFGQKKQLKQLSNITIENARTFKISIFDNTIVNSIKNALLNSNLGINPMIKGNVIKIILPSLTEDRRYDLFKIVRSEAEQSRINIRNIRRFANDLLKKNIKNKTINNDIEYNMQNKIQNMTDNYISQINTLLSQKEREIMNF